MNQGKVMLGAVLFGVTALLLTTKGSWFNPGRHADQSNVGRFVTPNPSAGIIGLNAPPLEDFYERRGD